MPVELERRDDVDILTLNRPEALNALSFAVLREIEARVTEVEQGIGQGEVRALLVTGAGGRAFCAGADVKELTGRTPLQHRRGLRFGQALFERIADLPVPSIAVIDGFALGGGLELAMACTFRLATAAARMGLPEIKLGLVPGYGGTQRLPRLVGEANALDIVMTGRMVRAEEGLSMGLVNRIVEGDPDRGGPRVRGGTHRILAPRAPARARRGAARPRPPRPRGSRDGGGPRLALVPDRRRAGGHERVHREARARVPRCLTERRPEGRRAARSS